MVLPKVPEPKVRVVYIDFSKYGCQPKNRGNPPNHPFVHRVGTVIDHPFWGFSPYFWFNTHISIILF